MHLPDVNFWLALILSKHRHHASARTWLEGETEPAGVLFCRSTQQSVFRLLTTAAVLSPYGNPPLTNQEAWNAYDQWISDDRIAFLAEPAGLEAQWKNLTVRESSSPKIWMDAWLAAFAISAGLRLVTLDQGFKKYQADGLDLLLLT